MRPPSSPSRAVLIDVVSRRTGDAHALRAVLAAARLLGLACGVRLTRVASRDETTALVGELRLALARARDEIALVTERLDRIPARHRPHYTPRDRFHILELMQLHAWTTGRRPGGSSSRRRRSPAGSTRSRRRWIAATVRSCVRSRPSGASRTRCAS